MQSNRIVSVRRYAQPPPCGEVEKRSSRFSGGGNGASHRPPPEISSRCSQISTSPQGGGKMKVKSDKHQGRSVNLIVAGLIPMNLPRRNPLLASVHSMAGCGRARHVLRQARDEGENS